VEKSLFIVRGLPGSGKSTFASQISDVYFEADQYFINQSGEYAFDASKIKDAHEWCRSKTESAMAWGKHKIAVSNTFTQDWEMKAYYDLAEKYEYQVFSIIVENRHGNKNLHGVPDDTLKRMKDRFQISL
jgi:predicted kinase